MPEFYKQLEVYGNFQVQFVAIDEPAYWDDISSSAQKWLDSGKIDLSWRTGVPLPQNYSYTQAILSHASMILTKKVPAETGMTGVYTLC